MPGALGVSRRKRFCHASIERCRFSERNADRRRLRLVQAVFDHATRRRSLVAIPRARGLGGHAQQVAKFEIARIDSIATSAARSGEQRAAPHEQARGLGHDRL
jgi:hypothetical protein